MDAAQLVFYKQKYVSIIVKYVLMSFLYISFFPFLVGISGITWSVLWLALVSNSPAKQRWISAEELHYIERSLADDTHEKVLTTFSLLSFSLE